MRDLIRQTESRWIAAIVAFLGVGFLALPSFSFGQDAPFSDAVLRQWQAYQDFARALQGAVRVTTTVLETGKSSVETISIKRNPTGALCCVHRSDDPSTDSCMLANPHYSAEVERRTSNSSVLLNSYDKSPNAILPSANLPLFDTVFAITSPQFAFCDVPLSRLVHDPAFAVSSVTRENSGDKVLVRVDYTFGFQLPTKVVQESHWKGSIYFDPANQWCIRGSKSTEEFRMRGEPYRITEWETANTTELAGGFIVMKHQMAHADSYSHKLKKRIRAQIERHYDWRVDPGVHDEEFTLGAFGLPVPSGGARAGGPALYAWLLIGAGLSAMAAWVLRWFSRRRRIGTS
jgi:hypothetical protein